MPITYLDPEPNPKFTYLDPPQEDQSSSTASNISTMARPVLEMGGAIGGGLLGAPLGPIGAAAGGALGYATGKSAADLVSRGLGVQQPLQNLPQAGIETLQNASQGAQVEAGGLGLGMALKGIGNEAVPAMRRALGFSKGMLMNKAARESADQAAQVALEHKVMPISGNPEVAAKNLENLQQQSGQALGSMRQSVGPKVVDKVFDSLEELRNRLTQGGAVGGEWDQLHSTINDAQATILGLQRTGNELGEVGLHKIEAAKKAITDGINYVKKNASQETAKKIGGAIEDGVENILQAHGINMTQYAALKRAYGGASNALKALNNELASQEGNQALSLPAMVMGAGELGEGGPSAIAGVLGATEFLKRRGMGITANLLNRASKINPLWSKATSLGLTAGSQQ